MKRIALLVFILLYSGTILAQQDENHVIENITDRMTENEEQLAGLEELAEIWQYFRENPIPINASCSEQLAQTGLISDIQIKQIEQYKLTRGTILSRYELLAIPGFDQKLIETISPFLNFDPEARIISSFKKSTSIILRGQRTLETSKGYKENAYKGSPEKLYTQIKYSQHWWQAGLTAEKDPGEAFFRKPSPTGFDHLSAYAVFQIPKKNIRFVAGDFLIRSGQGLVLWQGFAAGKSAETDQIYRNNQGLRPYSSTDENIFFRGIASEYKNRNFLLNLFYSSKYIDANIIEEQGKTMVSSFQNSGLHRTENEITDRHSLQQKSGGIILSYQKNNITIGLTSIHTQLQYPMQQSNELWQQFKFTGKKLSNAGINFKWNYRQLFLFGEMATSSSSGMAVLAGLLAKPANQLELSLLYRNFNKKYHSFYGQTFSESSGVNDEQGLYAGIKLLPAAGVSISAYCDNYWFQWLKSQTYAPSQGTDALVQVQYSPRQQLALYLRYKYEKKDRGKINGKIKHSQSNTSQGLRINADLKLNECWSFRSRLEFCLIESTENAQGLLLFQDIRYKANQIPFSCQLRLAWFDTDDYDSRLYAYENELLYNFAVPALYGKGIRTYLNTRYEFSSHMQLWFKIARTHYFNQKSIGTGWDEISSERKTELKLQLRYRF